MHFGKAVAYTLPQFVCKFDRRPSARFTVEQRTVGNLTAQHFLKAHRLSAQLQLVRVVRLGLAALVFDRKRHPQSVSSLQGNAVFRAMKFHHIALTGHAEHRRMDAHGTNNQQVAAAFCAAAVRFLVQNRAVHRAVILRPLMLHMDERPLPTAECEMLQTGELEEVLLGVDYPSTLQVTPAGRLASSTVMV